MNRWFVAVPLVVLAALMVLFIGWSLKREPEYRPDAMVGQPVPTTGLSALPPAGSTPVEALPLAEVVRQVAPGQPVLINLFASWCAPCRLEHPRLMALKAQGVTVVGIAYKDDPAKTRAFLTELGDPFAVVLMDPEGRAGLDLGVSGVPETFAIDAQGRIVAKVAGPLINPGEEERLIQALGR